MKRILFVIPSMEIGGTRSSLINLLHNMRSVPDLEIDLFIVSHEGVLMDRIPSWVKVLPECRMAAFALPWTTRKSILRRPYRLLIKLFSRIFGFNSVLGCIYRIFGKGLFSGAPRYDTVISYQEGDATFTASLIPTGKLIIWIHSDAGKWPEKILFGNAGFDRASQIVTVSENSRKEFICRFPEYGSKCIVIPNTLNKSEILGKSKQNLESEQSQGLSLLSIGRLSEIKAFDRVVTACRYLKEKGYHFSWTLLGDGEEYASLRQMAKDYHVDDVLHFEGAQTNPFAYISKSDAVVVSSLDEGQPMVILEALTLSKPVLSTRFNSVDEVLQNGEYGLICDNDTQSFVEMVESLFTNPDILCDLKHKASLFDYDNDAVISKLTDIL